MRINAVLTWLAFAATWTWLTVAYIDARVARGVTDALLNNPRIHLQAGSQ